MTHADTQELFAAVDLSLCADYERLPGGADFTLVLFDFDGAEGMRGRWSATTSSSLSTSSIAP